MCAPSLDAGVKHRAEFDRQLGGGNGRSFPSRAAAALPLPRRRAQTEPPANSPLRRQPGLRFCAGLHGASRHGGPRGCPGTALIRRTRAWCSPDLSGECLPWVSQDTGIPFLSTGGSAGVAGAAGAVVGSMRGTEPPLQVQDGPAGSISCTAALIHPDALAGRAQCQLVSVGLCAHPAAQTPGMPTLHVCVTGTGGLCLRCHHEAVALGLKKTEGADTAALSQRTDSLPGSSCSSPSGVGDGDTTGSSGCQDQVTSGMLCLSAHGSFASSSSQARAETAAVPACSGAQDPYSPRSSFFSGSSLGRDRIGGSTRRTITATSPPQRSSSSRSPVRPAPVWSPSPRRVLQPLRLPEGTCTHSSPLQVSVPTGRGMLAWPGLPLAAHTRS